MDIRRKYALNIETWVENHGDTLYHFALTRVRKKDIAEDLVQETFLSAVRSQTRFKGLSSEKTWLFSIMKHKVLELFFQCLSRLPKRTADVFVYREIDGLDTAEICKRLGISASNCWTMLYRAKSRLRQSMGILGFSR